MNIDELQADVGEWHERNFGDVIPALRALIVCEEAGELAHVILKQTQGIRPESSTDAHLRDAIGDIGIALMALCESRSWRFSEILTETADTVLKRDWTKK